VRPDRPMMHRRLDVVVDAPPAIVIYQGSASSEYE